LALAAADLLRQLLAFASLDSLDDVCSGFPLRRLDRGETSVSGVSTDFARAHEYSPPFPGLCPPFSGIGSGTAVAKLRTRTAELNLIRPKRVFLYLRAI
jgi:hypothetical protein